MSVLPPSLFPSSLPSFRSASRFSSMLLLLVLLYRHPLPSFHHRLSVSLRSSSLRYPSFPSLPYFKTFSFSFHPTAAFPTPAVAVVVVVAAAVAVVVIGHTTAVIVVVVPDVILIVAAAFLLLLPLISSSLLSLRHTGKSLLTHASKRTRTCTSSCNTSADPHSSHYIDAHDTTSVRCATYPLHTDFHS